MAHDPQVSSGSREGAVDGAEGRMTGDARGAAVLPDSSRGDGRGSVRFGRTVLVPALTVMFGMQVFRVLLPLLVYVLRDRFGLQALHLGGAALILFSGSFLVGPLLKSWGARRLALGSAVGLALVRLVMQIWVWDPVVDLILAAIGTLFFLLYLPAALASVAGWVVRDGSASGPASGPTSTLALGLLTGLGLDTVLNGLLQSYDLAWREGVLPLMCVAALVSLHLYLSFVGRAEVGEVAQRPAIPVGRPRVGPWVAMGPMLALQMLLFQNVARLATLTGLPLPAAATLAGAAHVLGLVAAARLYVGGARLPAGGAARPATVARLTLVLTVMAGVLLALSVLPASAEGSRAGLLYVCGQVALAFLVMAVVGSVGGRRSAGGGSSKGGGAYGRLSVAHGTGMVLLVAFLFLAYSGYDISLPFSPDSLPPVAAVILGLGGVWAVFGGGRPQGAGDGDAGDVAPLSAPRLSWRLLPALLVAAAVVVPAAQWASYTRPEVVGGAGFPVRVMTFNLHNGFATDGRLDLEALARVIEGESPDIVALQEVSRGWVINGTVDSLGWLESRLGMRAVYGPTSGALWGNALLTRLPVVDHETAPLPTAELLLQRGYVKATVDLGDGERLTVIGTHYHHLDDGSAIRVLQSEALLRAWAGQPQTVVMGDLNARPGDPEIEMLRKSGLIEILDVAGIVPGYTFSSDHLFERIDYILATAELAGDGGPAPTDVRITTGTASDHVGIAATLAK